MKQFIYLYLRGNSVRITGFLDFVHHLVCLKKRQQQHTHKTFQKLDLFLSSDEEVGDTQEISSF
jgi:hypothetical protein